MRDLDKRNLEYEHIKSAESLIFYLVDAVCILFLLAEGKSDDKGLPNMLAADVAFRAIYTVRRIWRLGARFAFGLVVGPLITGETHITEAQ